MAILGPGDAVLVPNPSYPVHPTDLLLQMLTRHVPLTKDVDFFNELELAISNSWPKLKVIVVNFPGNPTTECVDLSFFEKLIAVAKEHKIWVVQDLAYADLVYDGYSSQYSPVPLRMPLSFTLCQKAKHAWMASRLCVGNRALVGALQE